MEQEPKEQISTNGISKNEIPSELPEMPEDKELSPNAKEEDEEVQAAKAKWTAEDVFEDLASKEKKGIFQDDIARTESSIGKLAINAADSSEQNYREFGSKENYASELKNYNAVLKQLDGLNEIDDPGTIRRIAVNLAKNGLNQLESAKKNAALFGWGTHKEIDRVYKAIEDYSRTNFTEDYDKQMRRRQLQKEQAGEAGLAEIRTKIDHGIKEAGLIQKQEESLSPAESMKAQEPEEQMEKVELSPRDQVNFLIKKLNEGIEPIVNNFFNQLSLEDLKDLRRVLNRETNQGSSIEYVTAFIEGIGEKSSLMQNAESHDLEQIRKLVLTEAGNIRRFFENEFSKEVILGIDTRDVDLIKKRRDEIYRELNSLPSRFASSLLKKYLFKI